MTQTAAFQDAWPKESATPVVEAYHTAIRKLVDDRYTASGKTWAEAVHDPSLRLTAADFEKIEADLLATGYRFEMSAIVSLQEAPDKYKPVAERVDSGAQESDEQGRKIVGSGDNVFKAPADVQGTARFVSTVDRVMELLMEGVPENTVAIIDDSGGTLTAPILGDFKAVICMGGTVRSHLGILTREYNVPCLMNATIDGLNEGDEIVVEYAKPAADAYADGDVAAAQRARIIKVS
jgi:hypothetical protein